MRSFPIPTDLSLYKSLIYISYFFLVVYYYIDLTEFNAIVDVSFLVFLGIISLIFAIIMKKSYLWKRSLLFVSLIMCMIGTIIYHKYVDNMFNLQVDIMLVVIVLFLFIATIGKIEINSLIRISFYTQLILFTMTITFSFFDIIPNIIKYRASTGVLRQSLGFSHPNTLALAVFCLTIVFLYLYIQKIKWYHLVLILCLNIFFYTLTYSRGAFICSVLAIFISFLAKYTTLFHKKLVKLTLIASVPIFFFMSIYITYNFSTASEFYLALDELFSNRLLMGNYYIEQFGLSLFGYPDQYRFLVSRSLYWKQWFVLDSFFIRTIMQYGIVVYSIIFTFVFIRGIQFCKKGYGFEVALIIIGLLYGFFERYSINIFIFSIPLLLFVRHSTRTCDNNL